MDLNKNGLWIKLALSHRNGRGDIKHDRVQLIAIDPLAEQTQSQEHFEHRRPQPRCLDINARTKTAFKPSKAMNVSVLRALAPRSHTFVRSALNLGHSSRISHSRREKL